MPVTGAEWLAASLAASGQTHVFFVDAVLRPTLLALSRHGVKPVLAHTEKAAVYMADAYARIAGRPGIVAAQSVGAANLASGLQDAFLARTPVIAMTGRKVPAHQHRNAYQEVAHAPLFQPVTKFAAEVADAADLPRLLRQAWAAAASVPTRPVHLDLAGLQAEVIEQGSVAAPPADLSALRVPRHRPEGDPQAVAAAVAALSGAKRIVVVAGDGAAQSGCGAELLAVAEALGAPILTTLGARGLVPTTHPLHCGVVGSYSAPPANRIVHGADLVLMVGCDTGDQMTHHWRVPAPGTCVVQVDADPLEFDRSYAAEAAVLGDPRAVLAAMAKLVEPRRDRSFLAESQALIAAWRDEMAPRLASAAVPLDPARLCAELSAALPPEAILVADTGYSGIWTGTLVEFDGAGQTYLRAAGSLGWSFPAALGAKCAAPDRPVVCFTGDGAFHYHLAELETARRLGLAVVVVINNNRGFGQGWPNVRRMAGNDTAAASELLRFGETADFAAIARGFGVEGVTVETPDQIAPALRAALAANRTVVLDVRTDIEARAPEASIPGEK
ncbi:MAG TPA: thiamine pyrophosphate-binding protein [Falsiroseomonas sp.]|jgi:acetolactate synthase-1/2/3 large subunit|nr:thiamine pyrophosphate-binding protein [Falsiroseomonas sp.]